MTGVARANEIDLPCAAQCGAVLKTPAEVDRVKNVLRPVAPYPYVCLRCWLRGWRSDGPITDDGTYRVYHEGQRAQFLWRAT